MALSPLRFGSFLKSATCLRDVRKILSPLDTCGVGVGVGVASACRPSAQAASSRSEAVAMRCMGITPGKILHVYQPLAGPSCATPGPSPSVRETDECRRQRTDSGFRIDP